MTFFAQLLDTTKTNIPKAPADKTQLTNAFNIVLATMGALAFFMLVLGGFRYVISQGQPDKVAGARRTMLYAIIGLVVIALAATIVNYVVGNA